MQPQTRAATFDPTLELRSVLADVDALARLRPNWDGEGAPPIDVRTRDRTKQLLERIANEAALQKRSWLSPQVSPTSDGDVELSWETRERWVSLTVTQHEAGVGCVRQERGEEPTYQLETVGDAVQAVLSIPQVIRSSSEPSRTSRGTHAT